MSTNKEPIHVISLGAGVQSSTMALMAAYGEITPTPVAAVFADTQAEPDEVYRWLEYLKSEIAEAPHPFPVHRITKGNLTEDTLRIRQIKSDGCGLPKGTEYINKQIPVFGINQEGKRSAAIGRRCTADYKVRPIYAFVRKLAQIKRAQKTVGAVQWIGISYDEIQRMKNAAHPWIENRWPLVDLKMRRGDCLNWMESHGFNKPPRSACFYCPFHSDDEWRRIRDTDKKSWEAAIKFDRELRERVKNHDKSFNMEVFLHSQCKPLDQVDLSPTNTGQLEWDMQAECEGMCGV